MAGTPIKVINYDSKIKKLERVGYYEEARKIRSQALATIPPSHQGPLLRSEGEDKLFRQKDFRGALETFESAISSMKLSPALYGVSSPDRIYGCAAQAAILCNETEIAGKHYKEFAEIVNTFSKDPKLENALKWHWETLNWLESHLFTTKFG